MLLLAFNIFRDNVIPNPRNGYVNRGPISLSFMISDLACMSRRKPKRGLTYKLAIYLSK